MLTAAAPAAPPSSAARTDYLHRLAADYVQAESDAVAAGNSTRGFRAPSAISKEETPMHEYSNAYVPVTYHRCAHIRGPFYHGTKSVLEAGQELVPGYGSNFHAGRVSNNI